jgi:hypothetical protein
MSDVSRDLARCLLPAALAASAILAWQSLTVHANYAGNWTGLFRIGWATRLPDRLVRGVPLSHHPDGYDGQHYRVLAHDPFLRREVDSLDNPELRARRILVPLLAWVAAGGRQSAVDPAYVLVIAGFAFAGVYWLARIMLLRGRPAALGLLFLAVPATLSSADSMTVDVALAALSARFVWQLLQPGARGMWITLALAGLVRETGLLLVAAAALAALVRREVPNAARWSSAALPALCWFGYVHALVPAELARPVLSVPRWVIPEARLGIVLRMFDPLAYPDFTPLVRTTARALDVLALASTAAAAILAALRLRSAQPPELKTALALHCLMVLVLTDPNIWINAYSFSRPLAPLFVFLLAGDARTPPAMPMAVTVTSLVDLRVLAEVQSQASGVVRWLFG